MTRLDRYIASQMLAAVLVIVLVIIGLDVVFQMVDEADDLSDSYPFSLALYYVLLRVPASLYEFLPLAGLVGSLVGLGMLASNSELTVMRAAGVSVRRIVFAVLKPALLLALLGVLLGEFVVPHSEQVAQSTRALAQSAGKAIRSQHGVWHREGNQFIHINAVEANGTIHGITRYQFDDRRQLRSASFAQQGHFTGQSWQLENIQRTHFEDTRTRVEQQAQEVWQTGLTPTLLAVVVIDPVNLSISGLWSYADYLQRQGLDAFRYQQAFWNKVLQPLAVLALVLVAASFVFGPLRSVTVGQRVVAGVVVGLVFKFSQDLLGPASAVIGFAPLLATLVPIMICLLAGGWLLRRAG